MDKDSISSIIDTRRIRSTIRMLFSYKGEKIELVDQRRVAMIAPGPTLPIPERGQSGFWFEVRDSEGRTLYVKGMFKPVRFEVEVFPEDPKESPYWRRIANPRGFFELLVPDIPQAEEVVLFSSPFDPERAGEPAEEIARYSLKKKSSETRGKD
jgi:hypothetical protein